MKKKLNLLDLPKPKNKKKWKEICDICEIAKEDVHGYYDAEGKAYVVCPECAKKLIETKVIVKNWKGESYGETIN